MKLSIEKAKESGVIKSVGDIKLSNEEKKVVKKEENIGAFTVKRYEKLDKDKVEERLMFSKYIYPPLKRNFKSTLRIIALVMAQAGNSRNYCG